MESAKMLLCIALVMIVVSDVIVARSHHKPSNGDMEAMVKDIDSRLINSEHKKNRRRRRHVLTQNMALMEFCLRNRHRCHQEVQRMRQALENRNRFTVVLIEK